MGLGRFFVFLYTCVSVRFENMVILNQLLLSEHFHIYCFCPAILFLRFPSYSRIPYVNTSVMKESVED